MPLRRDAQGNVLAIYNKQHNAYYNTETGENSQQTYLLNQKEQHLYGSSRLGIVQLDRQMSMMSWSGADLITQNQGIRNYELTNHLGNVLSTITDKGVITSAQDYYPFGLTLASRSFTEGGSSYRYSFNGKEDDKGLKQVDFENRIYRKDLGRFLSVDPRIGDFPYFSSYLCAANNPILLIDRDGEGPGLPPLYDPNKNFKAAVRKADPTMFDAFEKARNTSLSHLQKAAWYTRDVTSGIEIGSHSSPTNFKTINGIAGEAVVLKQFYDLGTQFVWNAQANKFEPVATEKANMLSTLSITYTHAPDKLTDILMTVSGASQKTPYNMVFTEANGFASYKTRTEKFEKLTNFVIEVKILSASNDDKSAIIENGLKQLLTNALVTEKGGIPVLVVDTKTFCNYSGGRILFLNKKRN